MVKKYIGHGIVWDAEKDKALCEFNDGYLITIDERVSNKLDELGYESEEVENDSIPYDELTVKELKELAKEKEIEGYSSMKKEQLIKALEGGE